jgi:hypothetical protein
VPVATPSRPIFAQSASGTGLVVSSEAFAVGIKGHIGASVEAHTPAGTASALRDWERTGFGRQQA